MTDPISDMLIRIKNAQRAGRETVQVIYSKFKHEIAKVLEKNELIAGLEKRGRKIKKTLEISLKPKTDPQIIREVKLFSKPSRRLYGKREELKHWRGQGLLIVSTSKGVMSGKEAVRAKLGGQLIAEIN